jgi:hypothetical protein
MVNQYLNLSGEVSSNATEEVLDEFSPASGEQVTTAAVYFDVSNASSDDDVEVSLFLEEQTIIDRIPGGHAPGVSEPLALDITLQQGDTLKFAGTETNSSDTVISCIVLQKNTNLPGD